MNGKIWILFKSEGQQDEVLATCFVDDGAVPKEGDRLSGYPALAFPDGDWAVSRAEKFSSFDTDQKIVICYCSYQAHPTDVPRADVYGKKLEFDEIKQRFYEHIAATIAAYREGNTELAEQHKSQAKENYKQASSYKQHPPGHYSDALQAMRLSLQGVETSPTRVVMPPKAGKKMK